ncbi:MAG: hypothetical protein K2K53_03885, partial [Oscillospiraceae bacterium]|nr:hypothetical protein [Oscillospiraceae bacterium]
MRIKRYCSLFLAVLLALGASGCGAAGHEAMTIQPAQLSADEEALGQLLDVDMDFYHIFDFQTEGGNSAKKTGVQSVQLTLYELADGEWAPLIQDREAFSDTSGRIALSFGKIAEGVRIAVQGENSFSSRTQDMTPGDDVLSMAHATSMLTSTTTIELDKETPLVIQIATTKGEIRSYGVEYFSMPREYAKHGYEHVYA